MTQYLIRSIEHNGETFTDVITVRDNERYQVVEVESKEEALKRYKFNKALKKINNTLNNNKLLQAIRKDSE